MGQDAILSYFLLRLQTDRDGVAQAVGVLRRPILIIDLHKLDFRELPEVQQDQVRNVELALIGCAGAREEDVRDAVADVEPAVAGEPVVEGDPAKLESLGGAGAFEVFIQRRLWQHIRARPAIPGHDEGQKVILVAEPVDHIQVDQPELWGCGRNSRSCRGWRPGNGWGAGGSTCSRGSRCKRLRASRRRCAC